MKLALFVAVLLAATAGAAVTEERKKLPSGRSDLATGRKLFEDHCGLCHGLRGEGGRGPVLAKARLSRAPDDGALLTILENGIRGTEMPGTSSMSDRELRQTAAYVRSLGKVKIESVPGDVARGGEIYRSKGGCVSCHALNGDGGVAGPALSDIGGRRSAAHLRESLLTPEAAVPDGYVLVTVSPKAGAEVTGRRLNEDSFSVQLMDASGRIHSFWKSELLECKKERGKSPMPSYKTTLSAEELTDLVAYLSSQKGEK